MRHDTRKETAEDVDPTLVRKARRIRRTLDRLYPDIKVPGPHPRPYQLLISVVLSAQCTDKRVAAVRPALFSRAATPEAMAELPVHEIEKIIRPLGLSDRKSKAVSMLSRLLLERHGGRVPRSYRELEALPGVGHKSAGIMMSQGFGLDAFPIDTHIHRLAARWGLSSGRNVRQTERDLTGLYPASAWNRLHLQIIYFGREHCPARGHDPARCPICCWAGSSSDD
ncbi:MAG: endonuclease III [Deltaproteobacteria bacterium]|nr:endonuclease III [Deltaproteobacteria bacterium]